MSTSVLVLRSFSGLVPGQVVDTTDWVTSRATMLEEDRYVRRLEHIDAEKAVMCGCGVLVLAEAKLHGCPVLDAEREKKQAERVAAAQKAAAEKQGQQPATAASASTKPAAPAAPAPAKQPA